MWLYLHCNNSCHHQTARIYQDLDTENRPCMAYYRPGSLRQASIRRSHYCKRRHAGSICFDCQQWHVRLESCAENSTPSTPAITNLRSHQRKGVAHVHPMPSRSIQSSGPVHGSNVLEQTLVRFPSDAKRPAEFGVMASRELGVLGAGRSGDSGCLLSCQCRSAAVAKRLF
jgi:hypothetical protein